MVLKELTLKNGLITYSLVFKDSLVLVSGNSGEGKTYLFDALQRYSNAEELGYLFYNNEFINRQNTMYSEIQEAYNKLVVIDTSEIVLSPELKYYISLDYNNQYIIFTHTTKGYRPRRWSFVELIVIDSVGYFKYNME